MFKHAVVAAIVTAGFMGASPAPAQPPSTSRLDDILRSGSLRVCTPGDYKPFALARADGGYEGLDIDLVQSAARALGVKVEIVRTSWPRLMDDFVERCDIAVGGISVSTERAKRAAFSAPYMVNGKAPITRCENVAKYQSVADINRPGVTVITNPGGSNERFVRANLPLANVVVFDDNVTIFDELLKGRADVMISESVETRAQQRARPGLCAVNPDRPLQYGEMAYLLPRGDAAMKTGSTPGCT